MAADALGPGFAKASTAMLLNLHNEWVFALHKEWFHLPTWPSQWWDMIENTNIVLDSAWELDDGLVQERCNSIAKELEFRFSCTNPSNRSLTGPRWRKINMW